MFQLCNTKTMTYNNNNIILICYRLLNFYRFGYTNTAQQRVVRSLETPSCTYMCKWCTSLDTASALLGNCLGNELNFPRQYPSLTYLKCTACTHLHTPCSLLASSPGLSRLLNVARRKGGGPGMRSHVRHVTDIDRLDRRYRRYRRY